MARGIIKIFLALVLLQACTKDNSHKEGLLSFGIVGSDNVAVHTKASDVEKKALLPEVGEADLGKFVVNAGTSNDLTSIVNAEFSSVRDKEYVVQEGSYVASAYNCTEDMAHPDGGFGSVRYYGTASFSVVPGQLTNVVIPCTVANSMVGIILDESFLKVFKASATEIKLSTSADRNTRALVFDSSKFLVTPGSESGDRIAADDFTKCAFYPASTPLYITIRSQLYSLDGNGEVKEYVYNGMASADGAVIKTSLATFHKIRISADLTNSPQGVTIKVGDEQETITNGISINGYSSGSLNEDE